MTKLDRLIAELCPDGVEFRPLGEIGEFVRGSGLQKKDFVENGVGCIHYGQIYTYYGLFTYGTKSFVSPQLAKTLKKVQTGDLIIASTSENVEDVCKTVAWLGSDEIVTGGHSTIFKHNHDPKYLSYCFTSQNFSSEKRKYAKGTKVIDISAKDLTKIKIPLPPLPIQREIVRILDNFTELTAALTAELTARKKQYEYYRNELLTFGDDVQVVTLGNTAIKTYSGGTPLANNPDYYGGDIPWLRTQEVRFVDIYDTEMRITPAALANSAAKWIPANCVIIAISGATAGRSAINKIPLTTNQHCCCLEIDPQKAIYRYVFHWVSNQYEQLKALGQGARSDLNSGIIKSYQIPLPSLKEQERIVAILDRFDILSNDISSGLPAEIAARQKQYEYYRDKLLNFNEKRI